jgi:hypothetical protein
MPGKEVSNGALKRIEFLDTNWARKEFGSLSPEAKQLVIQNVNNIFWLRNPERYNTRLDASQPKDLPYISKYNQILYSVIGETGKRYWERKVAVNKKTRADATQYAKRTVKEIEAREKAAPTPPGGILREGFTGEEFYDYIHEMFKEPYAEKEQVAFNIVSRATVPHLINARKSPHGKEALFLLHELLISDNDNAQYLQQANKVIAAIGNISDPSEGLLDKPYIFPAEFTLFDSSHITARLTDDKKIWVKLTQHSMDGHIEGRMLPKEVFTTGITLEPHEWVRFKLYDEGGITICRPAMYLLQLSEKSTSETWTNMINVGSLGLPGGPLLRVGGIAVKGGGRLISVLSKLEKAADLIANGVIMGNLAVRENRGWIIKNYGDDGRQFIEYFDIAATMATFYGVGKAAATPTMSKALEKMVSKWDDMKKVPLNPEDTAKLSEIEKSVTKFKSAVKEYKGIDDSLKNADTVEKLKAADETSGITKSDPALTDTLDVGLADTIDPALADTVRRGRTGTVDPALADTVDRGLTETLEPALAETATPLPMRGILEGPNAQRYIRRLGEDTAQALNRLGMTEAAVNKYLSKHIWQVSKSDISFGYMGGTEAMVRNLAVREVNRVLTLGDDLAKKVISYGYDPNDIARFMDQLMLEGNNPQRIKEMVRSETALMDHLKDNYFTGSEIYRKEKAVVAISAADGNVNDAIRQEIAKKKLSEWKSVNKGKEPGKEVFLKIGEEARQELKNIESKIIGATSSPSTALIFAPLSTEKKDSKQATDTAGQRPKRKETVPREKLKIRERKKNLQNQLKEKQQKKRMNYY